MRARIPFCVRLSVLVLFVLPFPASQAEDSSETIKLFNGKDLTGWKIKGGQPEETLQVGEAKVDPADPRALIVRPGGADLVNAGSHAKDLYTDATFGDGRIEVEFMVPKGSNSGIYVMGEYEIQILDSFGRQQVGPGDVGGLYGAQAPSVNAAKAPGEWQKFVIDFRAPTFDSDGKKTGNARFVRITLNDQVIHENVEMSGPTPGGLTGRERAVGPLMFQGNHGPVAFRNIRVSPLKEK